jgi:hypothetical protein
VPPHSALGRSIVDNTLQSESAAVGVAMYHSVPNIRAKPEMSGFSIDVVGQFCFGRSEVFADVAVPIVFESRHVLAVVGCVEDPASSEFGPTVTGNVMHLDVVGMAVRSIAVVANNDIDAFVGERRCQP